MAEQNPPIFIQAGSHPAEDTRRAIDALVDSREGIVGSGDFAVSQNGTPNMTVNVAAGRAFVGGSEATFQGAYFVEARSVTNLAVSAAHATNARKDLVVAKVEDAAYSGGTSAWSLAVVAGTPSGSPAEPSVPNNALVLAMIDVPALDTSITNAQITDRRTTTSGQGRAAALGGVIVCTSTTRPPHSEGRVIYETDTDDLKVSDGSAWGDVASPPLFARKTADESVTSNTTLQNDDHLFLSVAANTTYAVSAYLKHEGTNGEIKFDFTVPAGATLEWQSTSPALTHSEPGDIYTRAHTGSTAVAGTESATIATVSKVDGLLIVAGTAGTLQLRWAQNASSATATELLTNSWLRLDKVA